MPELETMLREHVESSAPPLDVRLLARRLAEGKEEPADEQRRRLLLTVGTAAATVAAVGVIVLLGPFGGDPQTTAEKTVTTVSEPSAAVLPATDLEPPVLTPNTAGIYVEETSLGTWTWTRLDEREIYPPFGAKIAHVNGRFYASEGGQAMWISDDGLHWSSEAPEARFEAFPGFPFRLFEIDNELLAITNSRDDGDADLWRQGIDEWTRMDTPGPAIGVNPPHQIGTTLAFPVWTGRTDAPDSALWVGELDRLDVIEVPWSDPDVEFGGLTTLNDRFLAATIHRTQEGSPGELTLWASVDAKTWDPVVLPEELAGNFEMAILRGDGDRVFLATYLDSITHWTSVDSTKWLRLDAISAQGAPFAVVPLSVGDLRQTDFGWILAVNEASNQTGREWISVWLSGNGQDWERLTQSVDLRFQGGFSMGIVDDAVFVWVPKEGDEADFIAGDESTYVIEGESILWVGQLDR